MLYSHIHPSYFLLLNISLLYFHIHPTYFLLPKYIPDIFPNPSFLLPTSFFLNVSVLYFPIYPSYFLIPKNIHANSSINSSYLVYFLNIFLLYSHIHPSYFLLPKYIPAVFPYPSFKLPTS